MTRAQLAHVLRAAANDTRESRILVIGSQAILGSFDEADLPTVATRSIEADLVFYKSANPSEVADQVDGAIGELSPFHDLNNYYAQGVDLTTPVLPAGWERRVVEWAVIDAQPAEPVCLEPHDLAVSKLAAMREKDKEFVDALLDAGLIDLDVLRARAATLAPGPQRRAVEAWPSLPT